jgi:DUF4097 and DUF4098 domain-containing protein YvlB
MPNFDTPEPISVEIDIHVGDSRVVASDRTDTVVEVHPSDLGNEQDVKAAAQTRVEYAAGRLLVKAPKQRALSVFSKLGSIDVTIAVPTGSDVRATTAVGAFRLQGRLGRCRIRTATGDMQLDDTASLDADTSIGAVEAGHVAGDAEISTGSGRVRIGEVDGAVTIKNSNGQSWVGAAGGDVRISSANGDISVDRAGAGISAKTANGDVRIGELVRGVASLRTGMGSVEFGIRTGTAAQLDVHTSFGRVINQMDLVDGPAASDQTVQVNARTGYGDIVIHRA